jgi:hypothetical protein
MPEDIRKTGIIPVDVSGSESWAGAPSLQPGTCIFELTGWSLPQARSTGKRMLCFHFAILDGPKEADNPHANRGSEYRRNFVYESDGGRNYYTGLVNKLNEKAWIEKDGKQFADFQKIVGTQFEATLTTRTFPGNDGREVTGYDVGANTIAVTKAANGAGSPEVEELPQD